MHIQAMYDKCLQCIKGQVRIFYHFEHNFAKHILSHNNRLVTQADSERGNKGKKQQLQNQRILVALGLVNPTLLLRPNRLRYFTILMIEDNKPQLWYLTLGLFKIIQSWVDILYHIFLNSNFGIYKVFDVWKEQCVIFFAMICSPYGGSQGAAWCKARQRQLLGRTSRLTHFTSKPLTKEETI